jgi:hypothetical protein
VGCKYCEREKPLSEEGYCSKICKKLWEEEHGIDN